jgi:DNA-binding response OmpR family regulator
MLTEPISVSHRVTGLNEGADDYIPKPFHNDELRARVNAVLRRAPVIKKNEIIRIGNLRLSVDKTELKVYDRIIDLTETEFKIMYCLMQNPDVVVSMDGIKKSISMIEPSSISDDSIKTHIHNLKRKLGRKAGHRIKRVRRTGYKLNS